MLENVYLTTNHSLKLCPSAHFLELIIKLSRLIFLHKIIHKLTYLNAQPVNNYLEA